MSDLRSHIFINLCYALLNSSQAWRYLWVCSCLSCFSRFAFFSCPAPLFPYPPPLLASSGQVSLLPLVLLSASLLLPSSRLLDLAVCTCCNILSLLEYKGTASQENCHRSRRRNCRQRRASPAQVELSCLMGHKFHSLGKLFWQMETHTGYTNTSRSSILMLLCFPEVLIVTLLLRDCKSTLLEVSLEVARVPFFLSTSQPWYANIPVHIHPHS